LKPDTYIDETNAAMFRYATTIQVTPTAGQMQLVFDSGSRSDFKLAQFHVHAPSEHTIDGKLLDLELHFVHTYLDGSLGAVIGVMFDREKGGDGDNLFIDQLNGIFGE
jgi:carbonic anhydrase